MVNFITSSDVINALNMEQIDATTYRLYGEKVKTSAIDSHVQYANDYVTIYAGNIDSSDPRYNAARLAALNMAMIRIVVVALGGTVYDNVNYQIGEIQVNVGPQLEQTIAANLELWREHFELAMNALVKGMSLATIPFGDLVNTYLSRGFTTYETGAE